uniref:Uncharacterized protein n=1 Tax=Arundo donax TaxID=35708 RepID=A0A0A8Z9W7_ARUDO
MSCLLPLVLQNSIHIALFWYNKVSCKNHFGYS